MNYSLGNMLGGGMIGGLDPSAKAYIDAVVAAGGTVSGTQREAINTFVKTGKTAGWYSSLKRMYLPIWGVAAPNAIDMIGLTSGTFVGTVTPSAGYVNTNGTTGHFLTDTHPSGMGCTLNNMGHYTLFTGAASITQINSQAYTGSQGTGNIGRSVISGGSAEAARFSNFGPNSTNFYSFHTAGDQRGIIYSGRVGTDRFNVFRNLAGVTSSTTTNTPTNLNNTHSHAFLAYNNAGTVGNYSTNTVRWGAGGLADGLSSTQAGAFTLALKNLWETCTGLTLP
jgi:hypothetical protein